MLSDAENLRQAKELFNSIPDIIKRRGYSYENSLEFSELQNGNIESSVQGTRPNPYRVVLNIEQQNVFCECPAAKPCKHISAVLKSYIDKKSGKSQPRVTYFSKSQIIGEPKTKKELPVYESYKLDESEKPALQLIAYPPYAHGVIYNTQTKETRLPNFGIEQKIVRESFPEFLKLQQINRSFALKQFLQTTAADKLPLILHSSGTPVRFIGEYQLAIKLIEKPERGVYDADFNLAALQNNLEFLETDHERSPWEMSFHVEFDENDRVELNADFLEHNQGRTLLFRDAPGDSLLGYYISVPENFQNIKVSSLNYLNKNFLSYLRSSLQLFNTGFIETIPEPLTAGPLLTIHISENSDENSKRPIRIQLFFCYARDEKILESLVKGDLLMQDAKNQYLADLYPVNFDIAVDDLKYFIFQKRIPKITKENKILADYLSKIELKNTRTRNLGLNNLKKYALKELPVLYREKYLVLIEKSVIGLFKKSLSVKLNLKPGYNIDWFSVEISIPGLTNEDEQYILSRLQAGEKFIKLQNGTWISLEHLGLEKAIAAIQNAGGKKQDALEYTGLDFQSALALALEWDIRSEEKINSFRDKLESIDTAASLPVYKRRLQGFQATLRDYQTEGMLFFMRLHDLSAGGILADDMGLGKTVQALAFLYILFKRDASLRFLAVVPLAAVSVWKNEAARFCSSLPVHLHHGANRDKEIHPPGLTITTYQTLLKDKKMFKERRYETVLCDEAQMIKNAQTGAAKSLRAVQSTSKFCLTGTPVENRVDDLWSLMDLVFPGYLGRIEDFTSRFAEHDLDDLTRLRKKIKPFLLRRTKSSVLKELPDLTENTILIEMTARQKALYAEENARAKAAVQSGAKIFEILSWLTRLRRTACHPQIADAASIDPGLSGKLSYLQEILEELYVSSSGVLIFSQFTDMLTLAGRVLEQAGHSFFRIDGSVSSAKREKMVKQFQAGEKHFFLISLKAGGFALTLHRADSVIHLDPWWNPAAERQATDRAHRIGQLQKVNVYKFISQDSIEQRVLELQNKKREMYANLLESEDLTLANHIDQNDLMGLLNED